MIPLLKETQGTLSTTLAQRCWDPGQAVGQAWSVPLISLPLNAPHHLAADPKGPVLPKAPCLQTGPSGRVLRHSLGRCRVQENTQHGACLPAVTILPGAPGSPGEERKGEWSFPGSISGPINHFRGF